DKEERRRSLQEYVSWYNHARPHHALKGLTPIQRTQRHLAGASELKSVNNALQSYRIRNPSIAWKHLVLYVHALLKQPKHAQGAQRRSLLCHGAWSENSCQEIRSISRNSEQMAAEGRALRAPPHPHAHLPPASSPKRTSRGSSGCDP
ncbi:MAG: transposase, partial [Candidatus Wildermuthbacteria bacterium]|nr:transposase [Candidatus Wildermuthbacteria bacterium]